MFALLGPLVEFSPSVGIRGHMGHIGILVVAVRRLSRRKVKTLLLVAGPSPTSLMKAKITISPISNTFSFPHATSISFKF